MKKTDQLITFTTKR